MDHKSAHRDMPSDPEDDTDALFASLENENEDDFSAYRAHRIEQLNAEFASSRPTQQQSSSSNATFLTDTLYPTLTTDQAVLDFTTQTHRCVIHFAHPDFARCSTMDEHIRALATKHHDVRFARVDVRHTPFVVEKLKIRVLPCVIGFKDGLGVERVVGFEGLGVGGKDGADGFSMAVLEKRLLWKGILTQTRVKNGVDGEDESEEEEEEEEERRRREGKSRRGAIRTGNTRAPRNHVDDDDDDWD